MAARKRKTDPAQTLAEPTPEVVAEPTPEVVAEPTPVATATARPPERPRKPALHERIRAAMNGH